MKIPFNPRQQAKTIANVVSEEIAVKYDKGQKEHGGNFFTKPTTRNIREEVLDLICYTHVQEAHQAELTQQLSIVLEDAMLKDIDPTIINGIKRILDLSRKL